MEDRKDKSAYPIFKINGRMFPIWILHNFKKYKLPEIIRKDDEDPCQIKTKEALRKYQDFIASYLDYNSPYHDILLYHGLGSGKSGTAINVYNVLYNANSGWNVFLLIPASLHAYPWEDELKKWLSKEDFEHRYSNIIWIHYDSPFADKDFADAKKRADATKKNMYVIDEAHDFIRNVYSNLSSLKKGTRAVGIYDSIIQDKKDNPSTRVILLSGTPAINKPYELALMFNLLRPEAFPKSEVLFNQYYVDESTNSTISPKTKNMFQRRIMGLVSYYIGATPDLYANQTIHYVDVPMSSYQTEIYDHYEDIETKMSQKKKGNSQSETYRTYTRQASNFVFPAINDVVTGENRPRPNKFKIGEREMEMLLKSKDTKLIKQQLTTQSQAYFKMLDTFINSFDEYLQTMYEKDKKTKYNIEADMDRFKNYETFDEFFEKDTEKSQVIKAMLMCSRKYVNIIFNLLKSSGPVLVYTNYVLMEGISIFKVYLKYFGFEPYNSQNAKPFFGYAEFHNDISSDDRKQAIKTEKIEENVRGKIIKIMIFSPAGRQGISLENIRQVHIIEPYFHEVRIIQMIGRAVRQCSHKMLPMNERQVDIYRYRSVKHNIKVKEIKEGQTVKKQNIIITDQLSLRTVDFDIEDLARNKQNMIQNFLDAVKEVAIDCELNKNHNMMVNKYRCFQFNEVSLFDKNIGPAYKEDMTEDKRIDNGSNSTNTITIKVKAMKIKGIIEENKEEINYWYNPESGTVYDFDLHYPIGRIKKDLDGIPIKTNKDTYHIELLHIPEIK
jgi:superfamily II DNA or RNA helicase